MEGRKVKRGRPKSTGGQPSKKSRSMDDSEQEMMEKIEAANVLSSLRFMPTKSKESSSSTSSAKTVNSAENIPLTHKNLDPDRGNSARHEAPSIVETSPAFKLLPQDKGRVKAPDISTQSVMLSEQTNKLILLHLYNSLLSQQSKPEMKVNTTLTSSNLPSDIIIPKSEAARKPASLPNVLLPQNPVNRAVAAALKNAISVGMARMQTPSKQSGSHTIQSAGDTDVQEIDKKNDSVTNSLPLKKRRILASQEITSLAEPVARLVTSRDIPSEADVQNLLRLAQSTQVTSMISEIPTSKTHAGDGYKPIDPTASLRVLSDVKQALTPDEDGDLPIHIAVVHKNNALVKRFVEIMTMSGKSVDRYNKLMQTPLHLAVLVEEPDIIITLLQSKADPNLVDRNGCTAVHLAVEKGYHKCLETILDFSLHECNLDTRNYEGYSPLHTAVENNDFTSMDILVKNGANIDSQDGKAGRSVVYYAVEYRRHVMCRYLHHNDCNLDLPNYAGITPAMAAQSTNQDKLLDFLGKPIDSSRPLDGSAHTFSTRKLPLPRIPSKVSLIGPDRKQPNLSRTNSIEDVKPYPVRRQSETSPVDLSLKESAKNEDVKPFVKAEETLKTATTSILKSTLTGKTKYKPAKLVEKHAVLVEQLQRQSKPNNDSQSYVYLPKEKYKALLELTMQRQRAPQSRKIPGRPKARTLSVDEKRADEYAVWEKPLKSDLIPSSKLFQKAKADKAGLNKQEFELIERIRTAKSMEGKEGQALLSVVLDSDLNVKLSKLREHSERMVSAEKQLQTSMKLRTVVAGKTDNESEAEKSTSATDSVEMTEADTQGNEKSRIDIQEITSLGRQGPHDQEREVTLNSDKSEKKSETQSLDDSDDLKLSQGFDTKNVRVVDTEHSSMEKVSENVEKPFTEIATVHEENKDDKENDTICNELDKMDSDINEKVSKIDGSQEEDSSSVEVEDVLPLDEDDGDGTLVIDEKGYEDKSVNSDDEPGIDTNSNLNKTDTVETVSENAAADNVEIRKVIEKEDQMQSKDSEAENDILKTMSEKDSKTSRKEAAGNKIHSESTCHKTNSNTDYHQKKETTDVTENNVVSGKVINRDGQIEEKVGHSPYINDKEMCNVTKKTEWDKEMCNVTEKTEWETVSLATSKPPPLTKFELTCNVKETETCDASAENDFVSPPQLSHFGSNVGKSDFEDKNVEESDKKSFTESVKDYNYSVNSRKNNDDDVLKPLKEIPEMDRHVLNKVSKFPMKVIKENDTIEIYVNESKAEKGKTQDESKKAEQNANKYMSDSGFLLYLEKLGVKRADIDLEQHYLAYKNIEARELKAGKVPLIRQNSEEKTVKLLHRVMEGKKVSKPIDLSGVEIHENISNVCNQATDKPSSSAENTSDTADANTSALHSDIETYSKPHTLFFFDGHSYRAVKVIVDDKETSSEQFKKMFSESLNEGLGNTSVVLGSHSGLPQVTSATIHSVSETLCKTLQLKADVKTSYGRAKDDNSVSYGDSRDKNISSLTKTSKSASFDSSRLRNILTRQVTKTDFGTYESRVSETDSGLTSQTEMDHSDLKDTRISLGIHDPLKTLRVVRRNNSDMNLTSVVDSPIPRKPHTEDKNEARTPYKKTFNVPSNPVITQMLNLKQPPPRSLISSRNVSTASGKSPVMTSEGTLTRVNPDIKNRLSKALQSPSRKQNITIKTDSNERLIISVPKTDSSERLVTVPSDVPREGNIRLQM